MNIFLLRHGACEDAEPGRDDSERRLTDEGAKSIRDSMPGVRSLVGQVEYILSSPFERAVQTAGIVMDYFKCRGFMLQVPELAAADGEEAVTEQLNKLIGKDNVVVIGHSPYLGHLARHLIGNAYEGEVKLKKGGMAKIHVAGFPGPGEGALRWIMTSDELRISGE